MRHKRKASRRRGGYKGPARKSVRRAGKAKKASRIYHVAGTQF